MAWIELHQSLPTNKKTLRLKKTLRINTAQAVGHLCMIWLWAMDNAQDGDLSEFTPDELSEVAGWSKDATIFVDALKTSGFVDADMRIHDWQQYIGKLINKRSADAERKRTSRAQYNANNEITIGCPEDVQRTSDGNPCDGAGNRTVPNRTIPTDTITYSSALPPTPPAGWNEDEAPVEDGAVNGLPQNGNEEAICECSDAYMRISGRTMPGGVTSEVLLRINDGVEPRVIIFAMGESAGKDVGYFRAIMRRLARDGIKTYAQLTASETKDGAKARAAPKPDYRDPSRYENMDMKGFTAAADDEFTIERLTAQVNGQKVP